MDALSDILSRLRLKGTLYFRTSFTSPWGVKVPEYKNVARYHFAHKGRCSIRIGGTAEPVHIEQGDLIIIPHGARHTLYCDLKTEEDALPLEQVIEKSGFSGHGTLVYGEHRTNHETQLICGHFSFDEYARHPLIDTLPSHILIRNYGEAAGKWMENTLRIIGAEAGRDGIGNDLVALKLSEIIFAQALRLYLTDEGAGKPIMAGFADPQIRRVLSAIHETPGYPWTLEDLSDIAGMSRTSFVNKFSQLMATTPLGYITDWRMQIARQMLADSSAPIIEVAENVGYQSEAAFGRAFKKLIGTAPATYRRQVQPLP